MDKRVFGQQAEKLLEKLQWSDSVLVGLCDVSRDCREKQWQTPDDVPETARAEVLAMLLSEVQIRGLIGRGEYFGTQTLLAKAAVYEAAAQAIAERAHKTGKESERMAWTEFRRILSEEIIRNSAPDEE